MVDRIRKYADLAVKAGVNLQSGQHLVIGFGRRQVYPEHIEFARHLIAAGYDAGAKFVQVDWGDEWWLRETVKRGSLETYAARAKWQAEFVEHLAKEGAAFIAIPASDPDLFQGVDGARVREASRSVMQAFEDLDNRRMRDEYRWTLISAPTQAWANHVHPELAEGQRFEALWNDILYCARATGDDPVADWKVHTGNLKKRADWLNDLAIESFHYEAPGTDLTVKLVDGYYFATGDKPAHDDVRYIANIPTEEVFSAPDKHGVNGTVTSTMPLNHNGSTIRGLKLEFRDGRIVNYSSETGTEALESIIEADEGSHYLGEVALVPVDSPISQMNQLFYNTLYDENASCHLAIGRAYPLVSGARALKQVDWATRGLNESIMHVDFMIGSNQLNIDAKTKTGQTVEIMRDGNWTHTV